MSQYFSIASGGYEAKVRSRGASLVSLKYQGRNLVDPLDEEDNRQLFWGDILVPWPNRIRDGMYTYKHIEYTVQQNEKERFNALHGLVLDLEWEMLESSSREILLVTTLKSSDHYPADIEVRAKYSIDEDGLTLRVNTRNIGVNPGPYGISIHPYLIADPEYLVDFCTLTMPAFEYMEVDSERLLPQEIRKVPEDFDFNRGKVLGKTFIDHAFRIDRKNPNQRVELMAPSGKGVFMEYSENLNWIQIHTADRGGGKGSRTCLAVEPMTCPPDAFNSGIDLIELNPGQSHESTWRIGVVA